MVRARPSAFDASPLEDLLHARGVRGVILTGQGTEQGILYSALEASVRRLQVVVAKDAVATGDSVLADAALRMMERNMCVELKVGAQLDLSAVPPPRPGDLLRPLDALISRPTSERPAFGMRDGAERPLSKRRQQLLGALAVVIARQGFSGTKVADVAREARVSLRTFYGEFSSKEECFLVLYRQLSGALIGVVRSSVEFDRPWADVARKGFATYFDVMLAQPRLTQAILIEFGALSTEAQDVRDEAVDRFASMLIDLVEAGREADPDFAARPLTPLAARGIVGAVTELVISHFARAAQEPVSELIDTAAEMLTSTLLTTSPAGSIRA